MSHQHDRQKQQHDLRYAAGSRAHVVTSDPFTRYVVDWRLKEALGRVSAAAGPRLTHASSILVMCSGEGNEGSVLCNMGYTNVTISDISDVAVSQALKRDSRLRGLPLNAENNGLPDRSYDVVIVHDGLHHLQNPVRGFTEMLRIARVAAIFLEPHDSPVGNLIGTQWEVNGVAENYVFRWSRRLVQNVAASYLPRGSFQNLSFSFWHHNLVFARLGKVLGKGSAGLRLVSTTKYVMDVLFGRFGNQFCGAILFRQPEAHRQQ